MWNPKIPIDVFLRPLYIFSVLSNEGALLEAILKWDRAIAGRCGVTQAGRMRRPRLRFANADWGGLG